MINTQDAIEKKTTYCNRFAQRFGKQRLGKQTSTERPFLCGP
jgi:hypothetical protein